MKVLVIMLQQLLLLIIIKIRSTGSLTLTSKFILKKGKMYNFSPLSPSEVFLFIKFSFNFFIKFSNNSIIQSFKIDDLCPQLYFD